MHCLFVHSLDLLTLLREILIEFSSLWQAHKKADYILLDFIHLGKWLEMYKML